MSIKGLLIFLINNKKVLAIIPARGGSKGLPNKNILKLINKPLIAWSIEQAQESKYVDFFIVSTDSNVIRKEANKYGAKITSLRPKSLSTDSARINDVVIYEIRKLKEKFDIILILQPTSPLRRAKNIDQALEKMIKEKVSSVVSAVQIDHPVEWTFKLNSKNQINDLERLISLKRRQDAGSFFRLNGSIYATSTLSFKNDNLFIREDTAVYVMSKEQSIDIDSSLDFEIAKAILKRRIKN